MSHDDSERVVYCAHPSKLIGSIRVSGAKNSVLKLLAASLLTSEPVEISNYPSNLLDVKVHEGMLRVLGKECSCSNGKIRISEERPLLSVLSWKERSIRNTLLILGALTARNGEGSVPLPGGCNLGDRKHDLHEMVLRSLGAEVWCENDMLCAHAKGGCLVGNEIRLPIRSTGATENAILCGVLARGTTSVWNPHIRPEIIDLIRFLRSMGAQIDVFGQERIVIKGVEGLHGSRYAVLPDNMEALTWLVGSVITGGDIEIYDFPFRDLEVPLVFLRESGARYYRGDDSLIVCGGRPYPIDISTGPYPGINSDMQPIFAVYGACAKGESRIVDLRFPGRYGYVEELSKMGIVARSENNLLTIEGGNKIVGAKVRALDLRAGIALSLAAFVAEGETYIFDAWQIERGYDRFLEKARSLGADIGSDKRAAE
jgi:UDP-N-acetylglucosamine 1-carboxyvinyltransferase